MLFMCCYLLCGMCVCVGGGTRMSIVGMLDMAGVVGVAGMVGMVGIADVEHMYARVQDRRWTGG